MKKHIANIITGFRILFSGLLIFLPVFSRGFYVTYFVCGISDMIDGTIARKTDSTSEFGARLDTVADFLFFVVSLIKIIPLIHIEKWAWIWIGAIVLIKIIGFIWGIISEKKLIFLHTTMNKITGLLLFILPLTISLIELKYSLIAVCLIATFSAVQEGYFIITKRI